MQIDRSYAIYKHIPPNGKDYIDMARQIPIRRWNKGKPLSATRAEKIAEERKRRCTKVIVAFDPATHIPIREFESCAIAATVYRVSKNVISRCAKGGRKTTAGYEWRYKNESF